MKEDETLDNTKTWLSVEAAADYIGMGKTMLYTFAREGRIPANKMGRKWNFEKAQLDVWIRSHQPMKSLFTSLDFQIEGNMSLRDPQREPTLHRRSCPWGRNVQSGFP